MREWSKLVIMRMVKAGGNARMVKAGGDATVLNVGGKNGRVDIDNGDGQCSELDGSECQRAEAKVDRNANAKKCHEIGQKCTRRTRATDSKLQR
eukprot:2225201-Rhodomonas_salina.2